MIDDRLVAGRYRLVRQLGSGGMGVVWQAHDERLDRTVAVKELTLPAGLTGPEATEVKRLAMREGRIAARLQHPNLIMVYDVTEDDGRPYLIMEYLRSRSLSEVLAERGTLTPAETARIGAHAAAALTAAHAAGVVHRDVKPGNVLLGEGPSDGDAGPDGAEGAVKITDFGISRAVEDVTTTSTGIITGTPAYLSPEVAKGDRATFSSDVFSLGSTLYTAIEGAPPFGTADNAMALLYRVASNQINPPRQAGPMTDVLLHLLRTDPAERPTMAEAAQALAAAARTGRPVQVAGPVAATTAVLTDADRNYRPTALLDPTPGTPAQGTTAQGTTAQGPTPPRTPTTRQPAPPHQPTRPPLSAYPPPRPPRPATRRNRGPLAAALIVLLAAAGALAALWLTDDETGTPATGATTAAEQPVPSGGQEPSAAPPTTTATQTPTPTSADDPPSAGTPVQAVTDYYGLMPENTEQGWSRLTERYQQSPGNGYDGYRRFWAQMSDVAVSEVAATGENVVEATVVYTYTTGRAVRERHSYTLVQSDDDDDDGGGGWLIDASTVLSSREQ